MIVLCDSKSESSCVRVVIFGIFRLASPAILSFTIIDLHPVKLDNYLDVYSEKPS